MNQGYRGIESALKTLKDIDVERADSLSNSGSLDSKTERGTKSNFYKQKEVRFAAKSPLNVAESPMPDFISKEVS